ncbi:retrovirus-related Pol polyprotein from transposon 297, partial [Nephila pilipes]
MPNKSRKVNTNMAQNKLPIEIIPFFDGSKEQIENFFTQIKRVAKLNKWDFLTTQAILSARLNGPALTFFSTNPNCKNAKNIDEVETLFYDFFTEKTTEFQRKLNFHNIQYYSGENIKNFAHRLETAAEYMLAQAQTNEAKTITSSIILSKFITSLPLNFQRKLSSKNPSTLKEAIDIAVKMQQNSETHTTCSMLLQPIKTVNSEKDSITQKLDELTNQIANLKTEQKTEVSQHISYRTPQQNTLPRHTVSCSFCGKPNHLMKHCWEFLRTIHTTPNQQQYSWPQQQSYWPRQQQQYHNRFQSRGSSHSNTGNYNRNTNYQQTYPKQTDSRNPNSKLIGDSLTNSPSHLDTQRNEELKHQTPHELIMNVNQQSPLPMIHVNIADEQLIFLIDSGSSISLIPGHIFDTMKHKIQHKSYLSRQCKIKSVNDSEINFSCCVDIPIHVNNKRLRQNFFITKDIASSTFQGLLGYDFLLRNRITLDLNSNTLKFSDTTIPVIHNNRQDNLRNVNNPNFSASLNAILETPTQVESKYVNISKSNINRTSKALLETPTHIKPIYSEYKQFQNVKYKPLLPTPKVHSTNNSNETHTVKTIRKIIIQPNETAYVNLRSTNINTLNSNTVLFQPKINQNHNIELHNSVNEIRADNTFTTLIRNIGSQNIHINKGANIGTISTEVTIEEQINEQSSVNAIQATADIIKKRCQDLKEADFHLDHLNSKDKNLLLSTLMKFKPAFSKNIKTLGHCDLVTPTISTIHPHPISSTPYPIPQSLQTHAQNYLEELIAADIIEENTAEWASPMVLVKKKNHTNDNPSLRLALDLRLLNNVIDGCSYPLPKIQDITTKLAGFKLFTVLDLNSAYWQIHLPKEYRKFLTFTTPWKTFQFKRLPFGIKHAAAYFQSMMDKVLSKCKHNDIHCYQDDIIIAANSIQELNAKLNDVLSTLQENNLTLAPDKCSFATQEIQYLGFTISSQGITPGINNTDKICKFTTPENQKQLKRFLGMCGYYRHLIPDYATKVHLLNISSNSRTFTWTSEHQEKFQELQ